MAFTPEAILAWLEALAHDPLSLAVALALATFVTEDGTLIAGSLLVGGGIASPLLVIAALAVGIVGGDIVLYTVGWSAREIRALRRRLPIKQAKRVRNWLRGRETAILFFSRFMPGTRLVTYLTFGFLRLSLIHFTLVMTAACLIWVVSIVLFISEIQKAFSGIGGTYAALIAAAIAIVVIIFAPKVVGRHKAAKTLEDAEIEGPANNG